MKNKQYASNAFVYVLRHNEHLKNPSSPTSTTHFLSGIHEILNSQVVSQLPSWVLFVEKWYYDEGLQYHAFRGIEKVEIGLKR